MIEMTVEIKRGDILLYYKPENILEGLVQVGEHLEDEDRFENKNTKKTYYHVSIAIDDKFEVGTNGTKVHDKSIDYTQPRDVIRLLASENEIEIAMMYIESFIGQKYDWTLIIDDALRYLTRNLIHLPPSWIVEREKHEKICTTFVEKYLNKLGYTANKGYHESPEDIYFDFRKYLVS